MKRVITILYTASIFVFGAMCSRVAWEYRGMICCIEHEGCSAPASVALLYAIPFIILIAILIGCGYYLEHKVLPKYEQFMGDNTDNTKEDEE